MSEQELAEGGLAGLDAVWVVLDSADAAAHDHAHGAGSHAKALAHLESARRAGRALCVRTIVTRSNVHGLSALGAWLAENEVAGWSIELARASDADRAMRCLPSIGLCAPRALHALAGARGRGVEPFVVGFPLCVLGPYATWSRPAEAGEGAHAAPCDGCPARGGCPGLSRLHRERFGARELRPLAAAVAPERSSRRDVLAPSVTSSKTSVD